MEQMNTAFRFNNSYRLNNGKVQYRISGYYPEQQEVLLKFGELPLRIPASHLQGIPLEAYLLEQAGFKKDELLEQFWKKDNHIIYLVSKGVFRVAYKHTVYTKCFRYFHQLQNIYFSNTGKEL